LGQANQSGRRPVEGPVLKVEIEGTYGEGGGQILRTALALSAVTRKPVHVTNVRGKRSPPGLRPQHKTAVETLARYVDAEVKGVKIGSTEVGFSPRSPRLGRLVADTGTAGSTTLILQSLLPVMLFSGSRAEVEVRGGTDNPLAPPVDYMERVLIQTLTRMGAKIELHLQRRGFYPKGGGIVTVRSEPVTVLTPINLAEFGGVKTISGIAYSSRLPNHIAPRMMKAAASALEKEGSWPKDIEQEILQGDDPKCALSPGCGIVLTAALASGVIVGVNELGKVGRPAEEVGRAVAQRLIRLIRQGVPVDEHLADQILVYMALAKGRSTIRVSEVTLHMVSCIYVCERFLGRVFTVSDETGHGATVSCEGVGFFVP